VKKFLSEFKAFLNQGNVVLLTVAFIMGLYFKSVVDAVLAGIVKPIIAAIVGKPTIGDVGFTINKAFFSVGSVIDALINFVMVGFVLFLIVKAYNKMQKPAVEEDAGPSEVDLLIQIRDSLQNR
jgi:large conductance mechanosensitive channel